VTKRWPGAAEGSGSKIGQPYKTTNGPMVVIWIGTMTGTGTLEDVRETPHPTPSKLFSGHPLETAGTITSRSSCRPPRKADRPTSRSREQLERGESGGRLDRPELARLLKDAKKGDVLLVESIDRLSRLSSDDWDRLRGAINSRGMRIVALDLPTSHQGMKEANGDEFTSRMLAAINTLMIEMTAAIARRDYEQRRARLTQGIEKAKAAGVYGGRKSDDELHKRVRDALGTGLGIRATARVVGCSATTVPRIRDLYGLQAEVA
jgi:DNA invertase Pin-like site-specific DNA recombinase